MTIITLPHDEGHQNRLGWKLTCSQNIYDMNIIFVLILVSLIIAIGFLAAFFWAVKSGQYDDDYTPAVRILFDDNTMKPSEIAVLCRPAYDLMTILRWFSFHRLVANPKCKFQMAFWGLRKKLSSYHEKNKDSVKLLVVG